VDIATLAKDVTRFLPPFLPYLLKAGEKTAEEAGKELGGDAWERARGLWHRLRPQIEAKPTAREAVTNAAATPQDEDAQAALRLQLRKLLAENEDLAREIGRQWAAAQAAGVTITASGERSVAAQTITGSTIITGDHNNVQSGKYISFNPGGSAAQETPQSLFNRLHRDVVRFGLPGDTLRANDKELP